MALALILVRGQGWHDKLMHDACTTQVHGEGCSGAHRVCDVMCRMQPALCIGDPWFAASLDHLESA